MPAFDRAGVIMRITREDGRVDLAQAGELCGVDPATVRSWISRGYWSDVLGRKVYLPSIKDGKKSYVLPVDLAKAEHATAHRARRIIVPKAA